MTVIDRIRTHRHTTAAVALDTIDLIAERVQKLLSWDRRISISRRYAHSDAHPRLTVGLTLDRSEDEPAIKYRRDERGGHLGVRLQPGLTAGFRLGAYAGEADSEAEVWARYHASDRRRMTVVTITGGLAGDLGPSGDDLLIIEHWNSNGVCDQMVIGFDTNTYWAEREPIPTGLDARPVRRYTIHCSQCGKAAPTYEWDSVTALWEPDDLAKLGTYALDDLGWKTNDGLTDADFEGRALVCPECWQIGWCETCDSPIHAWQEAVDEPTDRTMWHQKCGAPELEPPAEVGESR